MADSMKAAYTASSAAWDAGNTAEFDKYVDPNFVSHTPMPGTKGTLDDMKKMATDMKAAFPDMKTTIEDMRIDGDVLSARSRWTGTNTGPMMGMPATNKKVDVTMLEMVRFKDGKAIENWFVMEDMKMMQQLGMMPESGMPPADSAARKPM